MERQQMVEGEHATFLSLIFSPVGIIYLGLLELPLLLGLRYEDRRVFGTRKEVQGKG